MTRIVSRLGGLFIGCIDLKFWLWKEKEREGGGIGHVDFGSVNEPGK